MVPYKFDENHLTLYRNNNIDTKYEFDIVKVVNKIDKRLIGKPYMVLQHGFGSGGLIYRLREFNNSIKL